MLTTMMMVVMRVKMKMVVVTCLGSKLELKIFDVTNNHSDDADNFAHLGFNEYPLKNLKFKEQRISGFPNQGSF